MPASRARCGGGCGCGRSRGSRQRSAELDPGLPSLAVEQLGLQPSPERLDERVIEGVSDGSHRGHQAGLADSFAERPRSELGPVVAVDHGPWCGAVVDRHLKRVGDQRRRLVAVDRPAHDPAGMGVEHNAAIDLRLLGRVLRDIGKPEAVGRLASELTADEILGGGNVDEALARPRAGRPCSRASAISLCTSFRETTIWRPSCSSAEPACSRRRRASPPGSG